MKGKDILSIILAIVTIIGFIVFMKSTTDVAKFTTAFWSCLITAVSISILLVLNPWLVGKK